MNILASALTALIVSFAMNPAKAQIPVTDVASITNDVTHHLETLQQWVEEFRYWQQQYEALTGDWQELVADELGFGNMLTKRDTFPPELEDFIGEGASLFGSLSTDYERLRASLSFLPPETLPAGSQLSNRLQTLLSLIGKRQAAADNTFRSSHANLKTSDILRRKVQNAGTLKQATDLNARINAELFAAQSEANRMQSIQMRLQAEDAKTIQQTNESIVDAWIRPVPVLRY